MIIAKGTAASFAATAAQHQDFTEIFLCDYAVAYRIFGHSFSTLKIKKTPQGARKTQQYKISCRRSLVLFIDRMVTNCLIHFVEVNYNRCS